MWLKLLSIKGQGGGSRAESLPDLCSRFHAVSWLRHLLLYSHTAGQATHKISKDLRRMKPPG